MGINGTENRVKVTRALQIQDPASVRRHHPRRQPDCEGAEAGPARVGTGPARVQNRMPRLLTRLFWFRLIGPDPIGSIETIGVTPTDDHPSRSGMDFYARAMLSGMERVGIVDHL